MCLKICKKHTIIFLEKKELLQIQVPNSSKASFSRQYPVNFMTQKQPDQRQNKFCEKWQQALTAYRGWTWVRGPWGSRYSRPPLSRWRFCTWYDRRQGAWLRVPLTCILNILMDTSVVCCFLPDTTLLHSLFCTLYCVIIHVLHRAHNSKGT